MRVIIIGGGIMGLTLARDFHKLGYEVFIVEKEQIGRGASWVAGGMLAPQSEGLKPGKFLDFCIESRNIYKDYVKSIEIDTEIDVGYWDSGIFCPAFSEKEKEELLENLNTYKELGLRGEWIDRKELEDRYPSLGDEIIGGVLYPDDAQVDNRLLMNALVAYCKNENITHYENTEVDEIIEENGRFVAVKSKDMYIDGDLCILAAGAWSGQLSNIPVFPIKGEMAAVDVEKNDIDRVFFSSRAYLIPRKDYSRLVIGATEERVGFDEGNTVKGTLQLLNGLISTFPHMVKRKLQEVWYGYRPATPDLEPIIGESELNGLYYATGHHRNGILLAPITSKIIVDLIHRNKKSEYLSEFSYERFKS